MRQFQSESEHSKFRPDRNSGTPLTYTNTVANLFKSGYPNKIATTFYFSPN